MQVQQFYAKNQFLIVDGNRTIFQSYTTIIAIMEYGKKTILDARAWDFSKTTGKYRNKFLGESKEQTTKKINSGEYILANLNQ